MHKLRQKSYHKDLHKSGFRLLFSSTLFHDLALTIMSMGSGLRSLNSFPVLEFFFTNLSTCFNSYIICFYIPGLPLLIFFPAFPLHIRSGYRAEGCTCCAQEKKSLILKNSDNNKREFVTMCTLSYYYLLLLKLSDHLLLQNSHRSALGALS